MHSYPTVPPVLIMFKGGMTANFDNRMETGGGGRATMLRSIFMLHVNRWLSDLKKLEKSKIGSPKRIWRKVLPYTKNTLFE